MLMLGNKVFSGTVLICTQQHSLNPLHWAVVLNYEEGVKILLETGKADLNMDEHTSQVCVQEMKTIFHAFYIIV